MKTSFKTSVKNAEFFLEIAKNMPNKSNIFPEKFNKIMLENKGVIGEFSGFGQTEDGLERRNPLVVALGDSVTAGHFEFLVSIEELIKSNGVSKDGPLEITDSKECYVEKFRYKLIDKYETTSVSTINSGIAGDNLIGMNKRINRDVISFQPDLVLINASLNWPEKCGGNEEYKKELLYTIGKVKKETSSDIILLTPNMEFSGPFGNPNSTLQDRVKIIREVASLEKVGLSDTYAIWQEYANSGGDVKDLLSNGLNHPSIIGHEVFAITLMKLFDKFII